MDYIDPKKITYLPNTAGCFTSYDASKNPKAGKGNWRLEIG